MENIKVIRGAERRSLRKNCYEKSYWNQGTFVCGIDEAGRGPLAGPVVAAAVVLPPNSSYRLLKDSKILTEEERNTAYAWIIKHAWYGIGIESAHSIDTHNIYRATLRAMQKAFNQVATMAEGTIGGILTDAMPLMLDGTAYKDIPVHAFIQGESLSISVAAASIVAKVTRDHIMVAMDSIMPGYKLAEHKGYTTPEHQTALLTHGKSLIHRSTFARILDSTVEIIGDFSSQQSIF